jgi:hypothetical protein
MPKKTTHKTGSLILTYGQADQTVAIVAKIWMVKTKISGKECCWGEFMEQWDDFLVLHSLATDFMPDLLNSDAPVSQYLPLVVRDVLIQNVHNSAVSAGNKSVA